MRVKGEAVPTNQIRAALQRLLESRAFLQSSRLSAFVRFAVERMLDGRGQDLKEYTIATEIYGRRADFDPAQDSIVRSEARRLRRKLKEYYEGQGQAEDVEIYVRPGSYIPGARWRVAAVAAKPAAALFTAGDGVLTVVAPFDAPAADAVASACAFGVADEILHRLVRVPGVRAVSQAALADAGPMPDDALVTIGGTVRSERSRLRVTAHITGRNGVMLWSQRFDASIESNAPIRLQEAVAATLLARTAPRATIVRSYAGKPTHELYRLYASVLEAESLLEDGLIASMTAALGRFEALAERARDYARPLCGVAQCCVSLIERGVPEWRALSEKGWSACERALAVDPAAVDVLSAQGSLLASEWKWREAEERFRAALAAGEQHSAHRQFALFLLVLGRLDAAWKHLQIAEEIDLFSARQMSSVARFLYCTRRHQEADAYYAEHPQRGALPLEAQLYRALAEIERGAPERALSIASSLQRSTMELDCLYSALVAEVLAWAGAADAARALVSRHGLMREDARLSAFRRASLALSLADRAECLRLLRVSLQQREPELCWLATDPRFDTIRGDAEYAAIIRSVFPD